MILTMWGICLQTGLLISGYSIALNSQGHSLKGEEHMSGIIFIVCRQDSGRDYISEYFSTDNVVNNVSDLPMLR